MTKKAIVRKYNVITLTDEQFWSLVWGNPTDGYEVEEDGDWVCNGKCDYKEVIISKDNKYYSIDESRCGSPFSDYTYGSEYGEDHLNAVEVEKVEKITHEWRKVPCC